MNSLSFRQYVLMEQVGSNIDMKLSNLIKDPKVQNAIQQHTIQGLQGHAAPPPLPNDFDKKLDIISAGLDVGSLIPGAGTISGVANAGIYGSRAIYDKEYRASHVINALISLIPFLPIERPMAGLAKMLKSKNYRALARGAIVATRGIKGAARMMQANRRDQSVDKIVGQFGQPDAI